MVTRLLIMIYISPLCLWLELLCRSQWAGAREGALRLARHSMRHGLQPNIARVGQEMSMFKESNSVYFLKKQLYLFSPVSSCNLKTGRLSQTLKIDFSETLVIHVRDVYKFQPVEKSISGWGGESNLNISF